LADLTSLKALVHKDNITNNDRLILLIGSSDSSISKTALTKLCRDVGLDSIAKNIGTYIGRVKSLLISTREGYELNERGQARARKLGGGKPSIKAVDPLLAQLHAASLTVSNDDTRSFVEEAVKCLDARLYRAGIVFSWVGAIAVLEDWVLKNQLAAFNAEATARFGAKEWKRPAKAVSDFGRLREADFLLVLEAISLISKNVKQELEGCLRLRNSCGHPTALKVGEHKAAAHVETLLQNVYRVFG